MNIFYGYKVDGIIQEGENPGFIDPSALLDRPGELKYADLDGDGKTESIQVKETYGYNRYGDEYLSKWKLVINGKEVISHSFVESDLRGCTFFSILDIYTKDKYKEIGVNFGSADEDMFENYVEVYQYSGDKTSLKFKHYTYLRYIADGQKKKNTVKVLTAKYCDPRKPPTVPF